MSKTSALRRALVDPALRVRFVVRSWLALVPLASRLLLWFPARDGHRNPPVTARTGLVIDGFPSSGNDYVSRWARRSAADLEIGGHFHSPGQIRTALRLGIPVVVLFRDPREVASSAVSRWPWLTADLVISRWLDYYETLRPYWSDVLLVASRDAFNDLAAVFRQVSEAAGVDLVTVAGELPLSGDVAEALDRDRRAGEKRDLLASSDEWRQSKLDAADELFAELLVRAAGSESERPGSSSRTSDPRGVAPRSFWSQSAGLVAARGLGLILGVVATALLARSLGPRMFATFSLATTLSVLCNMGADLGIAPVVIRELNGRRPRHVLASAAVLQGIQGTISGLICLGVAATLTHHHQRGFVVCAVILSTAPLAGLTTGEAAAQAYQRIGLLATYALVQSALWTATAVGLYVADVRAVDWAIGFAASSLLTGLVIFVLSRRTVPYDGGPSWSVSRRLFREASVVGLATLIVLAYHRVDYLVLYQMDHRTTVGQYAAAYRILDQAFLVPVALVTVVVPRVAVAVRQERYGEAVAFGYRAVLLVAVLIGLGIFAAPTICLRVAFGSHFVTASPWLRVLACSELGMATALLSFQCAVLRGRSHRLGLATVGVLVVTLPMTFGFVKAWGPMGAAVATLLTETLAAVVLSSIAWRRTAGIGSEIRALGAWSARLLVTTAVAGAVAWLLRSHQLLALAVAMCIALLVGVGLRLHTDLARPRLMAGRRG